MNELKDNPLIGQLLEIQNRGRTYLDDAIRQLPPLTNEQRKARDWGLGNCIDYWGELPQVLKDECIAITRLIAAMAKSTGPAIRRSPLLTEADEIEASCAFKGMRAALRFRAYERTELEIAHDEDIVLGVRPSRDHEHLLNQPYDARELFDGWAASLKDRLDFMDPEGSGTNDLKAAQSRPVAAGYRPGTAFIMMWMSPNEPELADLSETVKECFGRFDINARRSDDIEHEDVITARIIDEIKTAEFLFADLTGERPNVYYEVGFAHALGRRVILYRKAGASIHFDLGAYNCPEYSNFSELKQKLMKRLEEVTGRPKTMI